jgi:xanthine dehydrogenase accessory factor
VEISYRQLTALAETGEPVAMATVVGTRGSTPREVGAKMLVRSAGETAGTVGGGCGEAQVFWEAVRALEESRPRLIEVDLTGEINDSSPTNCGGVMEVFVDCLRWDRPRASGVSDLDAVRALAAVVAAHEPVVLVVAVTNPDGLGGVEPGVKWIVEGDGTLRGAAPQGLGALVREAGGKALGEGRSRRAWAVESDGCWVGAAEAGLGLFIEVIAPAPDLVVVGAGHIAQPLVLMGKLLGFRVVVVDDRARFANRERFPEADEILVGRIEDLLGRWPIGASTYLVLVTRGHQFDEAALKVVVGSEAAYIGMIGSRRRVREVFRHLTAAGVAAERLGRVHAPIGLSIGAETPAEIAVAIVAELVQVRRQAARASAAREVAS